MLSVIFVQILFPEAHVFSGRKYYLYAHLYILTFHFHYSCSTVCIAETIESDIYNIC